MKLPAASVVIAFLFAGTGVIAAPTDPDIAGVTLGMSPAQAEAALRAFDPALAIVEDRKWQPHPNLPATLARISAKGPHDQISLHVSQLSGTVFAVARRHDDYGHNLQADVITAITEKFGPPSDVYRYGAAINSKWYFDAASTLQHVPPSHSTEFMQCESGDVNAGPGRTLTFCGNVYSAYVSPGADQRLNSSYVVTMASHKLLREEIARQAAATDAARNGAESQAARAAKPKL